MTEAEWLVCNESERMINLLTKARYQAAGESDPDQCILNEEDDACRLCGKLRSEKCSCGISQRQLRLWACACCRTVWKSLTDNRSRAAVELAERRADNPDMAASIWKPIIGDAYIACAYDTPPTPAALAHDCLCEIPQDSVELGCVPEATRCSLLREIIGNPFRPVRLCPQCPPGDLAQCVVRNRLITPTILSLAHAAYDNPDSGSGALDPVQLAVLADALEETGYPQYSPLLWHLRRPPLCPHCKGTRKIRVPLKMGGPYKGPQLRYVIQLPEDWESPCPFCLNEECGPHVRGCWVLDLILGRR